MVDCPLQSSIDALNTATPNLVDLMADLYIDRTMHIYLWQIDPPIKHRCLQYCYTTLGTSHGRSSIDLCKTIMPHKFDT